MNKDEREALDALAALLVGAGLIWFFFYLIMKFSHLITFKHVSITFMTIGFAGVCYFVYRSIAKRL